MSMASFADLRTGRRVTASREVLAERAGVSLTVLKRARRILAELGLAREMVRGRFLRTLEQWAAEAHHGRKQVKATSVWALVSPPRLSSFGAPTITRRRPRPPARRYTKAARRPENLIGLLIHRTPAVAPPNLLLYLLVLVLLLRSTRQRARARAASITRTNNPESHVQSASRRLLRA